MLKQTSFPIIPNLPEKDDLTTLYTYMHGYFGKWRPRDKVVLVWGIPHFVVCLVRLTSALNWKHIHNSNITLEIPEFRLDLLSRLPHIRRLDTPETTILWVRSSPPTGLQACLHLSSLRWEMQCLQLMVFNAQGYPRVRDETETGVVVVVFPVWLRH